MGMNRAAALPPQGWEGDSVSRRALFANAWVLTFLSPLLLSPAWLLLPQLYEAFTFLKGLGAVILVHAENGDLIAQVSCVAVHGCCSCPHPSAVMV